MVSLRKLSQNDQFGFSLVGAVIGFALLALVTLLTASLLVSGKKTEVRADLLFELQREQSLTLYRSRSVLFLKQQMGLLVRDPAGNWVANPDMSALASCFAGNAPTGQSCTPFNHNLQSQGIRTRFQNGIEVPPGSSGQSNCQGLRCQIFSTIEIWRQCDASRCRSIRVSARTELANDSILSLSATSSGTGGRESIGEIPGIVFGERSSINFDCGAGGFLTGVDYRNMTGRCSGLLGNRACNDLRPLNAFGQGINPTDPSFCKPMLTGSCVGNQYGFSRVGLFGNEDCLN